MQLVHNMMQLSILCTYLLNALYAPTNTIIKNLTKSVIPTSTLFRFNFFLGCQKLTSLSNLAKLTSPKILKSSCDFINVFKRHKLQKRGGKGSKYIFPLYRSPPMREKDAELGKRIILPETGGILSGRCFYLSLSISSILEGWGVEFFGVFFSL